MLILCPVRTDLSHILHFAILFTSRYLFKHFGILSERREQRKFIFIAARSPGAND